MESLVQEIDGRLQSSAQHHRQALAEIEQARTILASTEPEQLEYAVEIDSAGETSDDEYPVTLSGKNLPQLLLDATQEFERVNGRRPFSVRSYSVLVYLGGQALPVYSASFADLIPEPELLSPR